MALWHCPQCGISLTATDAALMRAARREHRGACLSDPAFLRRGRAHRRVL